MVARDRVVRAGGAANTDDLNIFMNDGTQKKIIFKTYSDRGAAQANRDVDIGDVDAREMEGRPAAVAVAVGGCPRVWCGRN